MKLLRLVDEVGTNSIIENKTFENTLIVGPAIIAPLDHVTMEHNVFDGDAESLFLEVPSGRRLLGVVGLRNVTFKRCEFRNIGIAGTHESLEYFRKGLGLT